MTEKVVVYAFYDIDDNITYCLEDKSGRFQTFAGLDLIKNYNMNKKKRYIFFSNVVFWLKELHSDIYTGHTRKFSQEVNREEPDELADVKKVEKRRFTIRNINFFAKGIELKKLMAVYNKNTVVEAMQILIRSIGEPEFVKYSLVYMSTQTFYNAIKEELSEWKSEEGEGRYQYYFYFAKEYNAAIVSNKSGLFSKTPIYAKDVIGFDISSAFVYGMISSRIVPIGRLHVFKVPNYIFLEDVFVKYLDVEHMSWFKVIIEGKMEGFLDFFDSKRNKTALEIVNIFEIMIDGRWHKFLEMLKNTDLDDITFVKSSVTGELPKVFKDAIIELYNKKDSLDKNSIEYTLTKIMLNSLYGKGIQTRGLKEARSYFKIHDYEVITPEIANHCAAITRFRLKMAILHNKAIYWDTDGIKVLDESIALPYFNECNENIMKRNASLGYTDCKIGTWKLEGRYEEFMAVGAKEYLYKENGKIKITWAGMTQEERDRIISESHNLFLDMFIGVDFECKFVKQDGDRLYTASYRQKARFEGAKKILTAKDISITSFYLHSRQFKSPINEINELAEFSSFE